MGAINKKIPEKEFFFESLGDLGAGINSKPPLGFALDMVNDLFVCHTSERLTRHQEGEALLITCQYIVGLKKVSALCSPS
jgi:hypothetical protein